MPTSYDSSALDQGKIRVGYARNERRVIAYELPQQHPIQGTRRKKIAKCGVSYKHEGEVKEQVFRANESNISLTVQINRYVLMYIKHVGDI